MKVLPKMGICPRCKGTGYEEFYNIAERGTDVRDCTYCNGIGTIQEVKR